MILDIPGKLDRRQSPRYPVNLDAHLIINNGELGTVTTRNISSNGLQIVCDGWVTDEIEPRGIQSHSTNHIRLKIIMELPVEDQTDKLYVNCRIMSVQRLSQDEYTLNLAFIGFENNSEYVLYKYLSQFQQRRTVINAYA
jgi:hypothetical protein